MLDKAEVPKQVSREAEQAAAQRAMDRARTARWDIDIAVFLFAVMIIVIILLFQEIGLEVVAPVAIFGLAMVWLVGWRRGRELYQRLHDEELSKLRQDLEKAVEEETVEEKVQKALRERGR